jgi:hypothetical protein
MRHSLLYTAALVIAAHTLFVPGVVGASDRTLPMRFDLVRQGPSDTCAARCKLFITATGAITADTPRDFAAFAKGRDLTGATVVLDSDGGSVHGAIALGRAIRKLSLDTTVGRVKPIKTADGAEPRGTLSPQADCESMCAFVLLGGVRRVVSAEARVMVHQIWLGDRRDDPTAANYSAEDLVLVQRDIGRLAQYTAEMGVAIDMLDLSLRIPPWEPMHALTSDELRTMRVATEQPEPASGAAVAVNPPAPPAVPVSRLTNGVQPSGAQSKLDISERRWTMVNQSGTSALARRHPLTVEGEEIGSFDLMVACGADGGTYEVSYIEHRYGGERMPVPAALGAVSVRVGGLSAPLKVMSSERRDGIIITMASAAVPADLIGAFTGMGNRSMTLETRAGGLGTAIRLGNTGARQSLPGLTAACRKPVGERADLSPRRGGGVAMAQ